MSNASDLKMLNSAAGRNEIAQRLFNAFREFKTKYDASLDYAPEQVSGTEVSETAADSSGAEGFGVQIFVLSRKLQPGDRSFKGYDVSAVRSGNVYKYIIKVSTAAEAEKLSRRLDREFPGSFPVRISGDAVSVL